MKKIIWVSSFPKSGNTFVRFLLANYFFNEGNNFNIDIIKYIDRFSIRKYVRNHYEKYKKISWDEIAPFWLKEQQKISEEAKNLIFLKTHNVNFSINNHDFTNESYSFAAIYIVRDPRDVAISSSKFFGENLNQMIEKLCNSEFHYISQEQDQFDLDLISTWSTHYNSWRNGLIRVPKIFIKYEDLLHNPREEFFKIIKFLSNLINFKIEEDKIDKSIKLSNFELLKKEEEKGFIEKSKNSKFFREGKIEQWKKILSKQQLFEIQTSFKKEMQELNYL